MHYMDAVECFENDRVARLLCTTANAAAQSPNKSFSGRAKVWLGRIERQLQRDKAAVRESRARTVAAKRKKPAR